jgi:hypothetical protein
MPESENQAPQGPQRQSDPATRTAASSASAPPPDSPGQKLESLMPALFELATRNERISQANRELGRDVTVLLRTAADTALHADTNFRGDVAGLLQDSEKALRERFPISSALRAELTTLVGTAPGLTNERVQALLQSTDQVADRGLVQSLRRFAADVGQQSNQDTPIITSAVETWENRVRLAPRVDLTQGAPTPAHSTSSTSAGQTPEAAATHDRSSRAQLATAPVEDTPSTTNGARGPQQAQPQQPANVTINRTPLDIIFDGVRGAFAGASQGTRSFDAPHTPMAGRLADFEARIQSDREGRVLARAEANGRVALETLQGFQNAAAASIMTRITDAARNNPGGLEAVLSEMRPGGRFADLRTQFNAALNTDRSVSAAYDKAASALSQYGRDRPALDAIIAKRPEASNLTARFESLDAQIGEAASRTPSRHDGKSMIDDLSKQIAEIFQRAVDSVRAAFTRSASATAAPSAGPSPGMSP